MVLFLARELKHHAGLTIRPQIDELWFRARLSQYVSTISKRLGAIDFALSTLPD